MQGANEVYKLSTTRELECDMIMIEGYETGSEEEFRENNMKKIDVKFEIISMEEYSRENYRTPCPNVSLTSNMPPTIRQRKS